MKDASIYNGISLDLNSKDTFDLGSSSISFKDFYYSNDNREYFVYKFYENMKNRGVSTKIFEKTRKELFPEEFI